MQVVGKKVSRGDFLKLSGAGVAGAALLGTAGCGGGGGGNQGGGGGGGGNTITVGAPQEPSILNPYITGGDQAVTSDVTNGVLQQLMQVTPDLSNLNESFQPVLLEETPEVVSEDPFVLEMRLREGITFSDGEALTSDDVRFTYETVMNPDWDIISREGWELVENFETPDERTVRLTFSEPYAPWRIMMTSAILPRHVYEGENFNEVANNDITGSGPFVIEEWNKGQDLTIIRNENFWGEAAGLERITFRFITDTNSLIAALEAGEVDFINPPPDIGLSDRLEGISGTTLQIEAGTTWEHLAFQLENVDNLKIRQAIAYGINRQQIIQEVLQGEVPPLNSVLVPEQEQFYEPAWEQYSQDQERASQLVEEAQAEGAPTTYRLSSTSGEQLRETLEQIVQQQLEAVGITIEIDNSAASTFFGQVTPEGTFEIGEWAWLTFPDPRLTELFSAEGGQNYYNYESEEATQLILESDRTLDQQQRAELLKQAQTVMAEDLPLIPLFQRPVYYAFNESLSGPQVNPTVAGPFWNVGEWTLE